MYPLDVTHVVLRRQRAGVRGRMRSSDRNGAGAPACSGVRLFFFFFFLVKKAYMPIDANHISNSKDRYSKPQKSVGSTAHPMTREAASPWHDVRYDDST